MILIPVGHDKLTVEKLPFATMGIILLCVIVYIGSCSRMDQDAIRHQEAMAQYDAFYAAHPYLELADAYLARLPKASREVYATQREWIRWYENSPEEAAAFLSEHPYQRRGDSIPDLWEFIAAMNPMGGESPSGRHDLAVRLGTDENAKVAFVTVLDALTLEEREAEQSVLDALWKTVEDAKAKHFVLRFGYLPDRRLLSVPHPPLAA